jgi:hypothetical protein
MYLRCQNENLNIRSLRTRLKMYRNLVTLLVRYRDKGKLFISAIRKRNMNLQFGILQEWGAEGGGGTHRLHREDYQVTWGGGAEGGGGTPHSVLARSRQPEYFTGQTAATSRKVS